MQFKVGDSVKVKAKVIDPDFPEQSIANWQGRIVGIEDGDEAPLLEIQWDSVTLKGIPLDHLINVEEEGYDWTSMILYPDDVVAATERDTEEDVEKTWEELDERLSEEFDDEE